MISIKNYNYKSWSEKYLDYNVKIENLYINDSWKEFFNDSKNKELITKINKFLSYCLDKTNGEIKIFPYPDLLFSSLNYTPLDKVKVVILGQDPYHGFDKINDKIIPQAMGLSFSVPSGIKIPSSLNNIYKNMLNNNQIIFKPNHGNLSFLAYQGCLLLNTSLTVQCGHPNSHSSKWNNLTDNLIKFISLKKEKIIFVLWGSNAFKKIYLIDQKKHKILVSSHPSGLSCYKKLKNFDSFNDKNHFFEINKYLDEKIIWQV